MRVLNQCNICGSDAQRLLAHTKMYNFLKCTNCGIYYVNPLPSSLALSKQYSDFYSGRRVHDEFSTYTELAQRFLNNRLSIIGASLKNAPPIKRFLDVGCGGGHCVYAASQMGLDAYGIELDKTCVKRANVLGIKNIFNCDLKSANFSNGFFDLVQIFHVLEHSKNPIDLLKSTNGILRPGGILVVDVPNQQSSIAKIKILLRYIGLEREDYGYLQPPIHLYAFTPETMSKMLHMIGFDVKKVIMTSPLNSLYFPVAKSYFSSLQGKAIKYFYRLFGSASYMSFFAIKHHD